MKRSMTNSREDTPRRAKKQSASAANAEGGRAARGSKDQDPLSQVLLEMKKPKVQVLDDASKDRIVGRLQEQMAKAAELDSQSIARKEPALHKLQMLPAVERAVSMRALQNTLLDADSARGSILCSLRDWIEPKDAQTLPALAVRSSVYNMLLNQLHPTPEQLKKTAGRGLGNIDSPIGATIVALRKHKLETPENKKLLKEIMEKWSRPIFSKLVDERSVKRFTAAEDGHDKQLAAEIRMALVQKYREEGGEAVAQAPKGVAVDAVLSGAANGAENGNSINKEFNRVRTPYSHGFLFNVQPTLKVVNQGNRMEKVLGEGRMRLFEKMVGSGKGSGDKGMGRKSNPRAMDMKI
mmetsp:Transcript_33412/g.48436  ORF Transcript_33412/g.48436 Transcript_33412/m.48436 type:complete len:352 (+) Transcript_33412:705-1760(+)